MPEEDSKLNIKRLQMIFAAFLCLILFVLYHLQRISNVFNNLGIKIINPTITAPIEDSNTAAAATSLIIPIL